MRVIVQQQKNGAPYTQKVNLVDKSKLKIKYDCLFNIQACNKPCDFDTIKK